MRGLKRGDIMEHYENVEKTRWNAKVERKKTEEKSPRNNSHKILFGNLYASLLKTIKGNYPRWTTDPIISLFRSGEA